MPRSSFKPQAASHRVERVGELIRHALSDILARGEAPDEAFEIESQCTRENARTEDAQEGPRAFMEKREPVFRGR